ncbi:MAG: hypothetical protein IJT41_00275 [Clostridia bacterium]|nr:hypothetical protein [Clostridia bacterium]
MDAVRRPVFAVRCRESRADAIRPYAAQRQGRCHCERSEAIRIPATNGTMPDKRADAIRPYAAPSVRASTIYHLISAV